MWRAFLEAHSTVIKYLERQMQEQHSLPLSWWDVLQQLSDSEGGRLRMGELAELVLLTRSGITRLLDRMITAGMVVREQCPGDRRGYYAVITQLGLDTIKKVGPDHSKDAWDAFLEHVTQEEAAVMEKVFSRVLAANK
jgi:DNA-binding MarR family transcriptional regulator